MAAGSSLEDAAGGPIVPGRLRFIEGMRGVAAFYVLLQHVCTMADPYRSLALPGAQPAWLALLTRPLWFGHIAVAAFIVISGFCLQMSLYNRGDGVVGDVGRFLKRRCLRILPPYYASLALSLLVVYTVTRYQSGMPWSQYLPVTPPVLISHLLLIHNLDADWMYKINGVLWSIAIEFQLYFVFPFMAALIARRWGGRVLLIGSTAVSALAIAAYPPAVKLYVWYVPLFALGMLSARLTFSGTARRLSPYFLGWSAVVFGASTIALCTLVEPLWPRDVAAGLAIASLLAYGAMRPGSLFVRVLDLKPVVWIGVFSYSLYLVHHPLMQVVYAKRPLGLDSQVGRFAYLAFVGIPIIVAGCYLFHLAFERPFLGAGKRS